ncbi:unnamed protein product [Lampetra fluviatilis]
MAATAWGGRRHPAVDCGVGPSELNKGGSPSPTCPHTLAKRTVSPRVPRSERAAGVAALPVMRFGAEMSTTSPGMHGRSL